MDPFGVRILDLWRADWSSRDQTTNFSRLFDDLLSAVTVCVIELCNVCLSGFKLPSFKLIFFKILIFVLRDSLVQSAAKKPDIFSRIWQVFKKCISQTEKQQLLFVMVFCSCIYDVGVFYFYTRSDWTCMTI